MIEAGIVPGLNCADKATHNTTLSIHSKLYQIFGLTLVFFFLSLNGVYMTIIHSYVQNDYLWTQFNTTGAQTFMSDVFNTHLWDPNSREIAMFTSDFASENDYSSQSTKIIILPTDARRVIMEHLQNITHAIRGLRRQTAFQSTRSMTSYCWVDFDQQWEVAHTARRQLRCKARYSDDGIMYMESMLRNTDWNNWKQMHGSSFEVAYGSALDESYGGDIWRTRTTEAMSKFSVEDEVRYWTKHNVTRYTIPWHNRHEASFDNCIFVHNALQKFPMALNRIGYQRRVGTWTSVLASFGVYNDMNYASDMRSSLVRNASNSFELLNSSFNPEMWTGGYPDTPWSILLHDNIGPLSSIDLFYVLPPQSAIHAIAEAKLALTQALQVDSTMLEMYQARSSILLQMVPPSWHNTSIIYYGGNPFCYNGKPRTYVHQSFGYDDACSEPHPRLTVDSSPKDILLALWIQSTPLTADASKRKISRICALNIDEVTACNKALASILDLYWQWGTPNLPLPSTSLSSVAIDIAELQIEIMQYVMYNNTQTILRQPIVDLTDPDWSFFGWLHILDWVTGLREVVAFEGDVSTFVLMSKQYSHQSLSVSSLETPTRFSYCIWLLMCYMCIVTGGVTTVALMCGILQRGRINGRNLAWFNCVLGVVWLGRPLLVLRGVTAIILLSSANINLVKSRGMTYFSVEPRSIWEAFVISGETVWLTYAVSDILTLLTRKHTTKCVIISTTLVWLSSFVVEITYPFLPSAQYSRTCESSNMDAQVTCTSGTVEIGSSNRFTLLCILQFMCIVFSYGIARAFSQPDSRPVPVIVPAIASQLFDSDDKHGDYYDPASCIFAGLLPWQRKRKKYVFSIVLWIYFTVGALNDYPSLIHVSSKRPMSGVIGEIILVQCSLLVTRTRKLRAVLAFAFLISSAFSSALFFYVSKVKLGNDFLWEGFNTTGMQSFLVDWYNSELKFPSQDRLLDPAKYFPSQFYNGSTSSVSSSMLYAQRMQFEGFTLASTILGIRQSDPCQLPWISTQYCFVDFDKRWEMANTEKRQVRCRNMIENGAVFVESILRNTDMTIFMGCWGNAIQPAIFDDLQQEAQGRQWLARLGITEPDIDSEAMYWWSKGITKYVVQWQNYKLVGVIETVSVESALGIAYPLTLKHSSGENRFQLQTSMKMYWGLGSDLLSISQNVTTMENKSLLRKSAKFAFQNQSIEAILVQNNTLSFPLDDGLTLVRMSLGPFGSIDLIHVPCPPELVELYKVFQDEDINTLLQSTEAQIPVPGESQLLSPIPMQWSQVYDITRGGNILCPRLAAVSTISINLVLWYSKFASCQGVFSEAITITRFHTTIALIAWGAFEPCIAPNLCPTVISLCNNTVNPPTRCINSIQPVQRWVEKFMSNETLWSLYQRVKPVQAQIEAMNIEIVQYVQVNTTSPIELARLNIFHDTYYSMMSWYFLIDWVNGVREVLSCRGDSGSINIMSSYSQMFSSTPNFLEVPTNLTYYAQLCIQYTTLVIFLVTFFAILYTFLCKGHIEGVNMLEINRVAGIVWLGRPLLFLRSIAAIMLLSTAIVKLETIGIFTRISPPKTSNSQQLSTFLAGMETCWLVIIVTDMSMVVTKDYTNRYSLYSSVLSTIMTVVLSVVIPVTPTFKLSRDCQAIQFDFQLTCTSGTIEIGSISRVVLLAVATSSIVFACYWWERWRHPKFRLPKHKVSLLLPAGAHYLYNKSPWIFNETLYLDKASAFMCGLIAFTWRDIIYLLDIKTWRVHIISIEENIFPRVLASQGYDQNRIKQAIPMVV